MRSIRDDCVTIICPDAQSNSFATGPVEGNQPICSEAHEQREAITGTVQVLNIGFHHLFEEPL